MVAGPYVFQSEHFSNDERIRLCANNPAGEIRKFQSGSHVAKIHTALKAIRDAAINKGHSLPAPPAVAEDPDIKKRRYDDSTARSVKQYKIDRSIINFAYQQAADDIVGIMTIRFLDEEMASIEAARRFEAEPGRDFFIEIEGDALLRGTDLSDGPSATGFARLIGSQPDYVKKHGALTVIDFLGGFGVTEPTGRILAKFDSLRKDMKKLGRIIVLGTSVGGRSAIRVARGITARGFALVFVALNDGAFDENDELLTNPGAINCPLKLSFFQSFGFTIDPSKEFHGNPAGFTPRDLTSKVEDIKQAFEATPSFLRTNKIRQGFADNAHLRATQTANPEIRSTVRRLLAP